jgi:hypothetical protein
MKRSLYLGLAALFLWSAHLREFHFLFFSHHEVHRNEHCSNHLHPAESQSCEICKWDLNLSPAVCEPLREDAERIAFKEKQSEHFEDYLNSFDCELRSRGPPQGIELS